MIESIKLLTYVFITFIKKGNIMKKLSLLFTFLIMMSCNNTAVKKVADSMTPDAEIVEVEKKAGRYIDKHLIGMSLFRLIKNLYIV